MGPTQTCVEPSGTNVVRPQFLGEIHPMAPNFMMGYTQNPFKTLGHSVKKETQVGEKKNAPQKEPISKRYGGFKKKRKKRAFKRNPQSLKD